MKQIISALMAGGLFVLLTAQQTNDPREGAGGIVFGPGFAFALGAPKGWIFDTQSATEIGSRVVIYPAGTDLTSTNVMIYANAFPLEGLSLLEWIKRDIASLKEEFPGIKISEFPNLLTADSLNVLVRGFEPAESSYELTERIGYIKIEDHIAIVSLSARDKETFDKSIEAFEYVVTGFSDFKKELMRQGTND